MNRFLIRIAMLISLASPALLAAAQPAGAESTVTVRHVETKAFPQVELDVIVNGSKLKTTDFHVEENNLRVPDREVRVIPLSETKKPMGTVLVVDVSGSMKSRGAITAAKDAAREFISAKRPDDWIALVSFGSGAQLRADFTQDADLLRGVVDQFAASGETALWDALVLGGQLFAQKPDLQPNLVLISDGADTVSSAPKTQALSVLQSTNAAVFAVAIESDEFDSAALSDVVGKSGGALLSNTDPAALRQQLAEIRGTLENQYRLSYMSRQRGGTFDVEVIAGGVSTKLQVRAGNSGAALQPNVHQKNLGVFGGGAAKGMVLLLIFLTVAAVTGGAVFLFLGDRDSASRRLKMYGRDDVVQRDSGEISLVDSEFLQRGAAAAGRLGERAGISRKVEKLLEAALLPLRPGEAILVYVIGMGIFSTLAFLVAPSGLLALLLVSIAAAVPIMFLQFRAEKRWSKFASMLPDMLYLLAGSLRAGYSLMQGIEAVAEQMDDPVRHEIRRVVAEARLSRSVEDALSDVAVRMGSSDLEWSVTAIRIEREVGGNLAEVLQTVAETMVERERLRRDTKALTAEGRMSAYVLGALPPGLLLYLLMTNPSYLEPLLENSTGKILLVGAAVAELLGFVWLKKLTKLEV